MFQALSASSRTSLISSSLSSEKRGPNIHVLRDKATDEFPIFDTFYRR